MKNLINRALVAEKRLFFILATITITIGISAENYRIDSIYHYFTFNEKPVVSKEIHLYNPIGQKIQSDSYFMQDGKWSKGKKIVYEYNSKGLLAKSTEIKENRNGIWYTQELYNYKDTLVTLIEKRSRRDTAEWEITGYEEFEYNSQNLMTRDSWLHSTLEEWKRYQYLYDPSGNKVQQEVYEWYKGEFKPTVRDLYMYNENNLLTQEKSYNLEKLSGQTMYEYDANNFLVQKNDYIEYNGIIHPISKETYVNNKEGKPLKKILYSNMDFKGVFVLHTKLEYTYDKLGNLTSKTHMGYIQGTWYPLPNNDEKWIYYYKELK